MMALRHLCAYHDCSLRDSVAIHLMRPLDAPPASHRRVSLLRPHLAAAVRGRHTARRLSTLDGPNGDRLPTPKPAASIAEVRALAAALCCCGGVHGVQAIDVRLGEEAIVAFAEVLRFSSHLSALRLNHVTGNSNAARQAMATFVDMLPAARAPLVTLDIAHNAHLEEPSLCFDRGAQGVAARAARVAARRVRRDVAIGGGARLDAERGAVAVVAADAHARAQHRLGGRRAVWASPRRCAARRR